MIKRTSYFSIFFSVGHNNYIENKSIRLFLIWNKNNIEIFNNAVEDFNSFFKSFYVIELFSFKETQGGYIHRMQRYITILEFPNLF